MTFWWSFLCQFSFGATDYICTSDYIKSDVFVASGGSAPARDDYNAKQEDVLVLNLEIRQFIVKLLCASDDLNCVQYCSELNKGSTEAGVN